MNPSRPESPTTTTGDATLNATNVLAEATALFDAGDYETVAALLRRQVPHGLTREEHRLLVGALMGIGSFAEAATVALSNGEDAYACCAAGIAFTSTSDWDQAIGYLEASLSYGETALAFYWLALAHSKRRPDDALDAPARHVIEDCLVKATDLGDCPPEAFRWLGTLIAATSLNAPLPRQERERDLLKQVAILRRGIEQHPEYDPLRMDLADVYANRLDDRRSALATLVPVAVGENPHSGVLWRLYTLYARFGDWASAAVPIEKLRALSLQRQSTLVAAGVQSTLGLFTCCWLVCNSH